MKFMKKGLSALLVFMMILQLFAAMPTVSAATPKVYDVISGTEKAGFPDAKQVYTLGNHDWESGTFGGNRDKEAAFKAVFGFDRCGLTYSDDEMEIYMIGAQGETGAGGGGEAFIQADIDAFDAYLSTVEGSGKVIFLQTHWPAHSAYNFKQRVVSNSDKVIDVINKHAEDTDIVWVWGHNHYEDEMRYVILQPGDQIMYAADTNGSSWGNPRNPQYKTINFTYANAGCMNDMWYLHDGHNDTNAQGNYRGPSACLSVAVNEGDITFTYNRIKQEDGVWTYAHDANLQIYNHNVLKEHPATVVVDRKTSDHEHQFEVKEVVAPTCTEGGYTVEKCKLCDRERNTNPTEALGHDWDEGKETTPATTEHAGVMTFTCKRCGETKTARIPRIPGGGLADVDFTAQADAGKYEIVNKDTAAVTEDTGIQLTPTADAFEPVSAGWGGEAAESTPKDLIKVPVSGDWTATTKVDFDQNEVQWAMNTYFGFLAMGGEDYQNMVGIRGTNNVFQDYLRKDGTIANPVVPAPDWQATPTSGFTANGTYFLRLDKDGTTYTGSWSADGNAYTELFKLENTDVDAEYIVLDAYKTSSMSFGGDASWLFTLKSLEFEGGSSTPGGDAWVLADEIEAGKTYIIVADGKFAMTNADVTKGSYAGGSITRGAAAVTIEDDAITSEVTDAMQWTFAEATSAAAYDGMEQYHIKDADGKYLRRGSMSQRNAALLLDDSLSQNARYYTWSFKPYEDMDATYAMYVNSERPYGNDYPGRVAGDAAGFDIPGTLDQRSEEDPFAFMNDGVCSKITLYTKGSAPVQELDKTALQQAISDAEKINKADYTDATVAALESALSDAKAALNAATQAEIDSAANALNAAIKALEKKPVVPDVNRDALNKALSDAV